MATNYKKKTKRQYRRNKLQTLPDKFQAGFLSTLDGRTELARALRDNCRAILSDIAADEPVSHIKAVLIERFCWLEMFLRTLEHEMATGLVDNRESIGRWIQGINSLCGLAKVLGVEHRSSQTNINLNAFDWDEFYQAGRLSPWPIRSARSSRKLPMVDRIQK